MGVVAEAPFAKIASAFIGVQNLVKFFGHWPGGGVDDFAVFDFEPDVFKILALVERDRVVLDDSVGGFFDRAAKALAIRDVTFTVAGDGSDAFDAKAEIGAGADEADAVGAIHEIDEGLGGFLHPRIIEGADFEVEVFKGNGGLVGHLGHSGSWPPECGPFCVGDALAKNDGRGVSLLPESVDFAGDIGEFGGVVPAS